MKFSYTLIKKYLPELKSKKKLIDALTMHAFEAEDIGGSSFDVFVPSNRYSDASSHIGIAKEAAAILGLNRKNIPQIKPTGKFSKKRAGSVKIIVKEKRLCSRYTAAYFENVKVKPSPSWMQKILNDCGLKPINNVVDIMNYVMLELGQPLHAFDAEKIKEKNEPTVIVRRARKGEEIVSIGGEFYKLEPSDLVIADKLRPLAVAGIKGGKEAEVGDSTTRILVESANFDPISVYKTSKKLGLVSDASLRFSHNLSEELAVLGLEKAIDLLQSLAGAKLVGKFDSSPKKLTPRFILIDFEKINSLIGFKLKNSDICSLLSKLEFRIVGKKAFIPILRKDIETIEDLAEEVSRLFGYNKLKPQVPIVGLRPPRFDDMFVLRDKIRDVLSAFGFDEVYNYSFVAERESNSVEIENPISVEKRYLRFSLLPLLTKNIKDNFRFFEEVKLFEIGKVFSKEKGSVKETNKLGIAFGSKSNQTFFELKGVVNELLKSLGLTDFFMAETEDPCLLRIESDHTILGYLTCAKEASYAEVDVDKLLHLVEEEISYRPLPRYPAVVRDLSLVVGPNVKIGEVIEEIQLTNVHLIADVDLIDEYFDKKEKSQSITLRIVFQAEDRTLNAEEVNKEMEKIILSVEDKFGAIPK